MPAKPIREYNGKCIIAKYIKEYSNNLITIDNKFIQITLDVFDSSRPEISFDSIQSENPWVLNTPLVVKPDQLIKRRGKSDLILLNATWNDAIKWISDKMSHEIQIGESRGILDHFHIEPFIPHKENDEMYLCIRSNRQGEQILFYPQGGINVGDVDSKAYVLNIDIEEIPNIENIINTLLKNNNHSEQTNEQIASFIIALLALYKDLNFVYMEINPLVIDVKNKKIIPLDLAAKLDECASFICGSKWGKDLVFPPAFGRSKFPEENFVEELDSKTGASLKLTILNHKGRIWTMVAGGGASVVYADTICDLGFSNELANYGEYSGAPDKDSTYKYAHTILNLMTRQYDERGKILIIGGGIANFTDVALTFQGIIHAIKEYKDKLKEHKIHIWVRRGGPNYQEGLRLMKEVGISTGIPIEVYGPETHMTAIVPMALGLRTAPKVPEFFSTNPSEAVNNAANTMAYINTSESIDIDDLQIDNACKVNQSKKEPKIKSTSVGNIVQVDKNTRCIVYGLQTRAVQGMLDFDFLCKREIPSVAALIFPFSGNHFLKFYWGTTERLVPVYQNIKEAVKQFPDVSLLINFSSFRSVFTSTMEALEFSDTIKTHAIIAEGVPESQARMIIKMAAKKGVGIIGPATVGGIKPGCLRIGNTGGMIDNIIQAKLYRPGSVGYVSKSGGMSNELNNIISKCSDGVYEGIAIGGDKYPGSTFIDHLLRYEDNPAIKFMVLLGEVGGTDEYEVCNALKSKRIKKPVVAWCIGTCGQMFSYDVQFGHAGACAGNVSETAMSKNNALKEAGAIVPSSFDEFGTCISKTFEKLLKDGIIEVLPEVPPPQMPMDYAWAKSLGLVRKPANFISSISDERGGELKYAGMPISDLFKSQMGVGGVIGLLWFRRKLPEYAAHFIEMVLIITADHGPAVSGAHNTIVTARAGKDLISSLVSGLLTIGPRFGGALDSAAKMFAEAHDSGTPPEEFVAKMRSDNKLIMGIGHRVKSLSNPDSRVTIIKSFAEKHFKSTSVLKYALEVEQITTKKKSNLILNVDGCIAACFIDLLRSCGAFTKEEVDDHIENGCLNGLFVLGRSIGFIGHYLDQKRLRQPLYRHPWDDISYMTDNM